MGFSELFAVSLQALRLNKLRSGLTLLGVIIGVMTVVSVLSVISGLNDYVLNKVVNLNPDVIVFAKYGIIRSRQEFIMATKRKPVTMRDLQIVSAECRSCAAVGAPGFAGGFHGGAHPRFMRARWLCVRPRGPCLLEVIAELLPHLEPGDTLTFMSDGVVEARDAKGDLFGFERTKAISGKSAEEIAEVALKFGQEDDITVLTLERFIDASPSS
jgi:hypothetical protein